MYVYEVRSKNKYIAGQGEPFKLSRTKIEDFVRCPRCFVIDRREGISPPSGPAFTLNAAVDGLLKKEFDVHRSSQTVHPIVRELGFSMVPFQHEKIDEWRSNFKGVTYHDPSTNLLISGALDDIWKDSVSSELSVVDYKATARAEPVEALTDAEYHNSYRRQIEVYQWLLRKNGIEVSSIGYWLYVTGRSKAATFDKTLHFDCRIISYDANDDWVSPTIVSIKNALEDPKLPNINPNCDMCLFLIDYQEIS